MAAHSSVLAWRIPGTVEPGGLPSIGSHRVGHNCSDLAAATAEAGQRSVSDPTIEIYALNIKINLGFLYGFFILFMLVGTSKDRKSVV